MYRKTIEFTGSIPPLYWYYVESQKMLLLQLPLGSGGIPFTFKVKGGLSRKDSSFLLSDRQSQCDIHPLPQPGNGCSDLAADGDGRGQRIKRALDREKRLRNPNLERYEDAALVPDE